MLRESSESAPALRGGRPSAAPATVELLEPRLLLAHFAIIGDYGNNNAAEAQVAQLVHSWSPDYIATVGDNNWPAGLAATIDANVGQFYHDYIAPYTGGYGAGTSDGVNRFFPSLGNHDWGSGDIQPYLDYFSLPGNERYYTTQQGPVQLFIVDSETNEPDGVSATSAQAQWLRQQLSASTAPWKLVMLHEPPYSSGDFHGSNTTMRWPFAQWGASAVFSGHDHEYERLLEDGIPYFVDGLGGDDVYGFGAPVAGSQVRYNADHGAMLVDATDTAITFEFINTAGQVIDTYSLQKSAPTYVSDLPFATATNGWGPVERDRSNGGSGAGDGHTMALHGVTYAKGLGVHAFSTVAINLAGGYSQFLADVGIDDEEIGRGDSSVTFQVLADGAKIYDSGVVTQSTPTQSVSLNVTGVQRLTLVVTDAGDGIDFDHADWAGARLLADTSPPTLPAIPGNLAAAAASPTQVNLTWADNSNNEQGFVIERSPDGVSFSQIAVALTNSTSYADATVSAATSYSYRICATNAAGDSAYSGTASVTTPANTATTTYLSDLAWTSTTNGWGPVEKNRSNGSSGAGDGRTLTLDGVTYAKGLGVHANAQIVYNLGGAYTGFVSDIGIDDEETGKGNGSVTFQVWADGVKVYDSGIVTLATPTKNVNLNVTGVQQITLVVTDGGDGIDFDHADWAGARFLADSSSPTIPAAPGNLAAAAVSPTQVNLAWADNSFNEQGFRIERSLDGAAFTQIGLSLPNATAWSDASVAANTKYDYRVCATNSAGDSDYTAVASVTTPATSTTTYLSDLTWVSAVNGWGPVEKDRSNGSSGVGDGRTITLHGVTCAKGLGVHASSQIVYDLGGAYASFLADLGIDDEEIGKGDASVTFQVWADGVKVYDSGLVTLATATKAVSLSVSGVQQLMLVVTDAGDGIDFDHADWAGARLIS